MTASMLWERFERLFEVERALPDGRIEATSIADWQAVLDLVRSQRWPAELGRGEHIDSGVPDDAAELFPDDDLAVTFAVWPDAGVHLNFFPLETSCIDFDFGTAEIQGVREFAVLLDAMGRLARAFPGTYSCRTRV